MPRIHKPLLFFAIAILFCFSAHKLYAQYPGMAAVRAMQNQQFLNQMQMQMQTNMLRDWRKNAGQGLGYYVRLKGGENKMIKSNMYLDSVLHKNFLVYVDKKFPKSDTTHRLQKIYPDQTLSISALVTDEYGAEEVRYGLPTDSGWTVKVITGSINIYAKSGNYLTVVSTLAFGSPKMDFAAAEIIGIQLNDGPIEKLSKENILKIIVDNPKATEYLEKKGLYEAVKKYNRDTKK